MTDDRRRTRHDDPEPRPARPDRIVELREIARQIRAARRPSAELMQFLADLLDATTDAIETG